MAANELFKHLKSAIHDFYDFDKKEVMKTGNKGRTLSDDRRALLNDLIDLVLYTNATNLETKVYLTNYYLNSGEVYRYLEDKTGKSHNKKTVINKIEYCKKKLAEEIGRDAVAKIVDYTTNDISEYIDSVAKLRLRYGCFDCFDSYIIDLSEIKPSTTKVEEERIVEVLMKLEDFKKENVERLKKSLDKEALSYIKYISSSCGLTGKDKEIKNMIKEIIEGEG